MVCLQPFLFKLNLIWSFSLFIRVRMLTLELLSRYPRKARANTLAECHCVLRGVLIHLQVERCV